MDPHVWGPTFWRVFHASSFCAGAPAFAALVECMAQLLPCKHCRSSFAFYVKRAPLACMADSLAERVQWAWHVHDQVDVKLKLRVLSLSKLRRRQDMLRSAVCDEEVWCFLFVSLLALMQEEAPTEAQLEQAARLGLTCADAVRPLQSRHNVAVCDFIDAVPAGKTLPELLGHFVACRARYNEHFGLAPATEATVRAQYEPCTAGFEYTPRPPPRPTPHSTLHSTPHSPPRPTVRPAPQPPRVLGGGRFVPRTMAPVPRR